MLRHYELFSPIDQTFTMDDLEFTKYVDICKNHPGPTPSDLVEKIKTNFFDFARGKADAASLERIWDFISPMLEKNRGLAQFTLDYRGDQSLYFFPWLEMVLTSPARALEMSYGCGYDLNGEWRNFLADDEYDIPGTEEDPICAFVRNDPTFVYNRQRQLYIADLACTIYDYAWDSSGIRKIVDFGAGTLAWARWHGYKYSCPNQDWVEIFACDMDKTINPDDFVDGKLNVRYQKGDIAEYLANPACTDADLAILSGVATYLSVEKLEELIAAITYILRENGTLFFDLQLDCPYLQRSMKLWGWPEMHLPKDPATAISAVEAMRKRLWQRNYKYSAEYIVDTYNATPSAVMITMTRL